MEQSKMTKQELQAKLEDTQRALRDAAEAFAKINALIASVSYHPDAPTEESPAYTIGAISYHAQAGVIRAESTI